MIALAGGALAAVSLAAVAGEPAADPPGIEVVAFMAGCWEGDLGGGATIRETYTGPRGGVVLGNSQVTAGGEAQFFEFSRISVEDGRVVYHPHPMGEPSVRFGLVHSAPGEVTFENPEHDYPQRIRYLSEGEGRLSAQVEKLDGSKPQRFEMHAVPCAGGSAPDASSP